jgi:signal peptidase I
MLYRDEKPSQSLMLLKRCIILTASIAAGFLISRIFIILFIINDSSMMPNIKKGERAVVFKIGQMREGDIVLVQSPVEPHKSLLKRIIARENDTVEIINKKIYINNKEYSFSWDTRSLDSRDFPSSFTFRDNMPLVKLKNMEYFIIGDNLDYSFDSRAFGPIHEKSIIGKLIFKF